MAVKSPAFRKKFPLLVTGSLLAVQPIALQSAFAAEQFDCQVSASGGWACAPKTNAATLPPRPVHSNGAVSSTVGVVPAATTAEGDKAAPVLVTASQGKALASRSADYSHLDWVARDKLTPAQLAETGPYCAGAYVEPPRPGMDDKTPLNDAPMFVSAKASRFEQEQQVATLAGDVVLRQSGLQVEADEASLHQAENRGELNGNVRLRDKGALVVGDHAELQLDTGAAKIDNAEYVMHKGHIRGSALYAKRQPDAIIRLKDGTYTRCEPGSNAWQLKGNNIKLNPETGFGSATNATLRVKDIPVFYTPYIYFPIDSRRQSGFLTPSISSSSGAGTTLVTPYYFNLAPNYDATLYPRMMSKHGLMMEGDLRYMTKSSEGTVGGAYLNDQDNENKDQPKYQSTRYLYSWQHTQGLDERLLGTVDYTDISDPYYFQDLGTDLNVSSQTFVNQQGTLSWRGDDFTARLNAQAYELATVADITPYNRLPQITLNGALPFQPGGLNLTYGSEFVRFDRNLDDYTFNNTSSPDSTLKGLSRATGDRTNLEPGISLPLDWTYGYLKPAVKYSYTDYSLDLDSTGLNPQKGGVTNFNDAPNRSIPLYSVDSGLYFDRNTSFFGTGFRQTLEPRLYYLYVPYKDQSDIPIFDTSESAFSYASLFRDNRFVGKDRIGDTNQLSFGTTSRFIEGNGFERAHVGIGQASYFANRKVQMPGLTVQDEKTSPTALNGQYRFNRDWRVSSDYVYNTDTGRDDSGNLMFHYQPQEQLNKIINAGYRFRNDAITYDQAKNQYVRGGEQYKIQQSDFSTIWPLVPQWNAISRWQFDYNKSQTLEAFGGFEYDSCCWKLRVVNRYWRAPEDVNLNTQSQADHGLFLQIVLKGLGGITGNKVDSFLDQGIQGYREREDQAF